MATRSDIKLPPTIDLASGNFAPVNQDININNGQQQQQAENPRWICFCCQIDKHAAVFLAQLCISFFVLTFSAYQLAKSTDNNGFAFYVSNFALVLGLWTNLNPIGGGGVALPRNNYNNNNRNPNGIE